MYFVEANALIRTGLAVGKDHGLAESSVWACVELPRIVHARLHGPHMVFHKSGESFGGGLSLKAVE